MLKLQILERENDDDKTFNYLIIYKIPGKCRFKTKANSVKNKIRFG
jgi:hypothetical protein